MPLSGLCLALLGAIPAPPIHPALPQIPERTFDVRQFGAVGDGRTVATDAIQRALRAAAKDGGTVEVPAGDYLCGPLEFGSRVQLDLARGATLRLLPLAQYPGGTRAPADFIGGRDLHDVAITGQGTIDGQGTDWWPFARIKGARRPRLIALNGCDRILIQGVKLMNSPMFHIAIGGQSHDVTVEGVTIRATPSTDPVHPGHNTDACDVSGHNVLVRDCDISVGDDDFTCGGDTSDVLITHNTYGYGHGVSIGSYTRGEVTNITVEDCTFTHTEAGIRIKTDRDRGGWVHHLVYRRLKMTDVGIPILVYAAYNARKPYRDLKHLTPDTAAGYPAAPVGRLTPRYEDITFADITATVAPGGRAGLIWGLPEAPAHHIVLDHVAITADLPFGIYFADVRLDHVRLTVPGRPLVTTHAVVSRSP